MTDPTKLTIDAAVEIEGREDTPQLTVQGHTTQDQPLQTWEDHSGAEVAQVSGDGSLDLAEQSSAPGTPPSGMVRLFADQADGHLKQKDDQGTVTDLAQAGGGSSLPDGTYLRTVLHDETLASPAANLDISSISGDYDHLEITILAKSTDTSSTFGYVSLALNNDTTASNYRFAAYSEAGEGESDSRILSPIATSHANTGAYAFSFGRIFLPFYADTDKWKNVDSFFMGYESSTSSHIERKGTTWKSTNAINRFTLEPNAGNFAAGTRIIVVGIKEYEGGESGVYPERATMWHDEATIVSGSSPFTLSIEDDQAYNLMPWQNPAANGDTFKHHCLLKAGTYTFYVLGITASNRGKMDWYIDDTLAVSGQDWYSSALTFNVVKSASVAVASDGWHEVKGVVNGKNPSGTDYIITHSKYWLVRTGD